MPAWPLSGRDEAAVTSGAYAEYSYDYAPKWGVGLIFRLGWRAACRCGQYCFGRLWLSPIFARGAGTSSY
jgi:hypothetical protein